MEIQNLNPRSGSDTIRLGDSDELVVMENFGSLPRGELSLDSHGLIVICTNGIAQFDYDGQQIQLRKNDLYLYMAHSVVCNFMSSPDFNCRQIWFSRSELWNINMYGEVSLADLTYLKQHPKVHLSDEEVSLLDDYFQLLCRRMRDQKPLLYSEIVRSLVSTMMLEMLCMIRRDKAQQEQSDFLEDDTPGFHRRRLADKFIRLVEQSDGRIRRVDDFASQLNVTPKYLSTLLKETMSRRPSEMIKLFTLKHSNHLTGCAVDIRCYGPEHMIRMAGILLDIADGTKRDFDELILEQRGTTYWIHFAVRPKDNRRKILFDCL